MKMENSKQTERFYNMSHCRECFSENMVVTYESNFNFIETIQKIKKNGFDQGCYNPTINNYYEVERALGLGNPNKVVSISICIPRLAHEALKGNIKLATILPLHIIIYEKEEKVYVAWWNLERMGKMFNKTIAGILQKKSEMLFNIHNEIIKKGGINECNG